MNQFHFSHPPRPLRRLGVRSDNIALVPASLLPFKQEWQRLAEALPDGDALFVVPEGDMPIRRSMRRVAAQLRTRGHRITAVQSNLFR